MLRKSYAPLSLVVVSRVWFVSLWTIVTPAPGTTAPVASVTLPTNVPYRACAVHVRGAEKFKRVARLTGASQRILRVVLRNKEEPPFVHQIFPFRARAQQARAESRLNRSDPQVFKRE